MDLINGTRVLSEGRNLQIEYRWGGFDVERIGAQVAELVGAMPDVLVATNAPIVAGIAARDPHHPDRIRGYRRSGGPRLCSKPGAAGRQYTGFTGLEFSLGEKWVGFLKELAPGVTRITYLFHPQIGPYYSLWLKSVEAAATTFGVETTAAPVRALADIEHTISAVAAQPNGGLVVQPDTYTIANRKLIIELAARHRVPAVYTYPFEAADGGLVSYGPDVPDQYRRCAAYVDRILKGERPADLPVQQPLKYELVVNLKTAKALGLDVPPSLLARADEVIE